VEKSLNRSDAEPMAIANPPPHDGGPQNAPPSEMGAGLLSAEVIHHRPDDLVVLQIVEFLGAFRPASEDRYVGEQLTEPLVRVAVPHPFDGFEGFAAGS
jgi:hypothetical protein